MMDLVTVHGSLAPSETQAQLTFWLAIRELPLGSFWVVSFSTITKDAHEQALLDGENPFSDSNYSMDRVRSLENNLTSQFPGFASATRAQTQNLYGSDDQDSDISEPNR